MSGVRHSEALKHCRGDKSLHGGPCRVTHGGSARSPHGEGVSQHREPLTARGSGSCPRPLPAIRPRRAWSPGMSQLLRTPTPGRQTLSRPSAPGRRRRNVRRSSATARATCGRRTGGQRGRTALTELGSPYFARRALTLPSTTACSPCRITFPGADTATSRAHIAAASRPAPTDSPTHQSGPRPAPPPPLPANSRAPCEGGTCGRPMGRGLCGVARRWGDSVG